MTTKEKNITKVYVATSLSASRPPPALTVGVLGWFRANLFRTPTDCVLSILAIGFIYITLVPAFDWSIFSASLGDSREACRAISEGACWGFIEERFSQFLYGFYPEDQRWRVNIAGIFLLIALLPLLFDNLPGRLLFFAYGFIYPLLAYWFLIGGFWGLEPVSTKLFGGIMLTILIGITGIIFSLPLGILLALGRRSDMIFVSAISVAFIEFIRGVPLITLLFVASTMLNYFFPPGTSFDLLVRVLIMVTLFSAGYIAEVVRGGLQAIPSGQNEASDALGLGYWQSMYLIILPQALKISIPGIVNIFIGLYKDTTLVLIIGMLDPLGVGRAALSDHKWAGLSSEMYLFIAIFFFICGFAMSRYSMHLERKLHTGH